MMSINLGPIVDGITDATVRSERLRTPPQPESPEGRHVARRRYGAWLKSVSWVTVARYRADQIAQAWHGRDMAGLATADAVQVIEQGLTWGNLRHPDWIPPPKPVDQVRVRGHQSGAQGLHQLVADILGDPSA